jgi:glycyl-tRNA synthetase
MVSIEKIVSLCKQRGFIFPSSEIYGGFASTWDYGPLGVELKNNVKKAWWQAMVRQRENIYGLDSAILMHPKIWQTSGHLDNFTDPLVDCKKCKKRFRADHLLEANGIKPDLGTMKEMPKEVSKCPECGGQLTMMRNFNLMFKTFVGPLEDSASEVYLRPETAQGIYVNFSQVIDSMKARLPFGVAQIGKAFRNEITPGNFTFRTREFEQMEMQFFVEQSQASGYFDQWQNDRMQWYQDHGIPKNLLHFREHRPDELAHYAKKALDIEFDYPFGTKELEGIHNRGDWDLSRHQESSSVDLSYRDPISGKNFTPWVVETAAGADRATLAFLLAAYTEVEGGRTTTTESTKEKEVVLKLDKRLAPFKVAVLPLSKKEPLLQEARKLADELRSVYSVDFDVTQSIGRRYRRQDEIGTPYCVTVDFDSLEDKKITVRDRDSMKQDRVAISQLTDYLKDKYYA